MSSTESNFSFSSIKKLLRANIFVVKEVFNNHRALSMTTLTLTSLLAAAPYLQRGAEALLINYVTSNSNNLSLNSELIFIIALIPGALLVISLINVFEKHLSDHNYRAMRTRFDFVFSKKLSELDVATHEDPDFKDKLQLVEETGSSFAVSNFYTSFQRNLLNLISIVVASVILISSNWAVLLIVVIAVIPRFLVEIKYGGEVWSIYQTHSEEKRHLRHAKQQVNNVSGIRELKIYNTAEYFIKRVNKILEEFHADWLKQDRQVLVWKILSEVVAVSSFVLVTYILIQQVIAGNTQIGTFIFVLSSTLTLQRSVSRFFVDVSRQYLAAENINTFSDIMKMESKINNSIQTSPLNLEESPEIIFENVSFAYPSDPNNYVLKNFNLRIEKGEKLAIVGINGAGKSTLIKLLCRFYDPTEGSILINGVDLRHVDLNEWYAALALLSQDYQTYKLPVKELVHLGDNKKKFDIDDIKKASKESDASEFIEKWDKAYDQQVGVEFKGGIDPSQGQKQKLALSRALFKNAYITILDEPTAAVDAKAEQQIFNSLEKNLGKDKTLILISHRFSTVRNADKIIVIDGNNIKEEGTHEELLKLNGMYAEMYHVQAKGYKD